MRLLNPILSTNVLNYEVDLSTDTQTIDQYDWKIFNSCQPARPATSADTVCKFINPLPHMPKYGLFHFSSKWKYDVKNMDKWGTIIWLSRKYCGKRRNCSLRAISSFPTMFSKAVCCWCVKISIYGVKG